jgi:hypothetical protein
MAALSKYEELWYKTVKSQKMEESPHYLPKAVNFFFSLSLMYVVSQIPYKTKRKYREKFNVFFR